MYGISGLWMRKAMLNFPQRNVRFAMTMRKGGLQVAREHMFLFLAFSAPAWAPVGLLRPAPGL